MLRRIKKSLKSRKGKQQRALTKHRRMTLEGLERRELLAVNVFQQGLGGYEGQQDTVLYSRDADVNFGTEGSISPDQQDSNGVRQGLLKFDDIFGPLAEGKIPLGSTINEATLVVDVVNDSNSAMQMSLYRLFENWSEATATWNVPTIGNTNPVGGIQASEGEASDLPPDAILFDPDTSAENPLTAGRFDVTRSLEYWAAGASNFGWMIESSATNGWDFRTKESAQSQRPMLTVDFTPPSGSGAVQFLNTSPVSGEGDSGTTSLTLEVARLGGTEGAISVNYAVTAEAGDSAEAGIDFAATSGQVDFADGETFKTITVDILGDEILEGNETFTVTLTDGTGTVVSGEDVASATIGDDDALINEVLANVSNAIDETNREYIELIGTPGASLDDYYFVVFEAEEEENGDTAGSATGTADFVVDLSGLTFGDNGLLVLVPGDPGSSEIETWDYAALADPDTNVVELAELMGAGGVLEDASQTYALIRSPGAAIVQGTDYDVVGAYENDTNQAIGTGLGVLDALPAGAQVIDSVGVVEGGGGDRDRTLAAPELGNPGIHVHQPTRINATSGNVTSDAVSRRIGQTLPNSIGVWFNGDIGDGDGTSGPIAYENDSFFISVVAPDGSVLTPGAPNILRNVFVSADDQDVSVAEADGSVTLTIERTGDIDNEAVDVTYTTVDFGSATENVDFTKVEETIRFEAGESSKDITINLLPDSDAEGFERFRVDITNVVNVTDAGKQYLITNGKPNETGAVNGEAVVTIADADVSIATFQNGTDGYFGTQDAYLDGELVFNKFGQSSTIEVDQVKGVGEDAPSVIRPQQGLIRFDDIVGDGVGQVPAGSKVFDAFLTVNITSIASGADVNFFRMLQPWEEVNASWFDPQGSAGGSIQDGITPDDVEAATIPDATVADAGRAGLVEIPLNVDTVQSWVDGSLDNFGWSIISDSGSLWRFDSSEAFLAGTTRPELTVLYTAPVESEVGTFNLSQDEFRVSEFDGVATITVNRLGGSTGPATVDWALTADSGDLADVGSATGSVSFADGEHFKTFDITITDDSQLEQIESLGLTISGTGLDFGRDSATLTIRDNDFNPNSGDLLLNEIWINSPGNDPPFEFVELTGAADMPLGSIYYVAIEGLVGDRTGEVEKIVDLSNYSSGSNGFTLLTPDAEVTPENAGFGFRVPDGTTQIDLLGTTATENVASQNDSTTYMLLYSPLVDLTTTTFDYDWDNSGSLELLSLPGVSIVDSLGVLVLGAEDQIYGPSTNRAQFAVIDPEVDAVSRRVGSNSPNSGSSWFGGDLFPAGDDYLLYEAAEAFGLPVDGAALTPGEQNASASSVLVSLTGATYNEGTGTVTLTFNGPVSQNNLGDNGFSGPGGAGITVTDVPSGSDQPMPIAGVDVLPTVTGFGTNELTVEFTGTEVTGGFLPAGDYQLNLVGNALIGNGRAVDAGNTSSSVGSDGTFEFTATPGAIPGDFNGDGEVSGGDLSLLLGNWGLPASPAPSGWIGAPPTGDLIDASELSDLLGNWGTGVGEAVAAGEGDASTAAFASIGDEEAEDDAALLFTSSANGGTSDDELLLLGRSSARREYASSSRESFRSDGRSSRATTSEWRDVADAVFGGLS